MPQTVQYRLTIRNASTTENPDGTADELVISSESTGTNPYIASAPSGDGAEVDPLTGAVRTGAYEVEIVDANTGTDATGTIRVLTFKLEDANFRQQLLSRRAYVDVYRDGVFSRLIAGYIVGIRLTSPMRYAVTVGDTRRVERTQTIFQNAALGNFTTRGCITGGPVTQDFGTIKARGGWEYLLTNVGSNLWQATFVNGYAPTGAAPWQRDWRKLTDARAQQVVTRYTRANPNPSTGSSVTYDFCFATTNQAGTITDGIVAFIGSSATNAVATNAVLLDSSETPEDNPLFSSNLVFYWPACPYGSGTRVFISLTTAQVTEETPLYLDAHPVDLVTAIWTAARVRYNSSAGWISAITTLVGNNVRLACRFPQAPLMDEFLVSAIYGPFGIGERTTSDGLQELFPTRIRTDTLPTLTLSASSMRGYDETVFDLDERTAISGVRLTQQVLAPASYTSNPVNQGPSDQSTSADYPLDGVAVSTVTQTAQYDDVNLTVFAGRVIEYAVPGMIHTDKDFQPNTLSQLDAIARALFDRYGRGCQAGDVAILATAAVAAAQIGDEVYFEAPHFPNKGYRIGESSVGARIMQVVRRTESPSGPMLRLLDSGLAAQPATLPVITIAQNPNAPTSTAQFTITNAATLNAAGNISVAVQWNTGSSTPTGGDVVKRFLAGQIETGAVDLPPVTTVGLNVWVRARSEQAGRRPSAWTAWVYVTLAGAGAVSGLATSNVKQTAATISWTNTSTLYPLAIFAYQGASAPANWSAYRVATLPARSTSTVIRTLTGPSVAWTIGVAYETPQALGAVTPVTVTTNSTLDTPTRPAGLAVIAGVDDATLTQGVMLAMWASDQTLDLQIQRSTVSGSGFVTIATVAGSTPVYVDQLPRTGTTYYYKIAHVLGGFTTSSYTPEVSAIARGVPPGVVRPGAVTPVVQVSTTEVGTTATVTLTITDPQSRVTQVRFRQQTNNGGWSAYTIDTTVPYAYSATIPASGFVQIEYEVQGFDAAGTALQVLAGGIESFDADAAASMVSVVGTFTSAGGMQLAISADSDTASIRFATSTSAQPTLATVQAQTAINSRNYATTLAGPFASGSTVFVSVLGYTAVSGGGLESVLFEYRFQRDATGLIYSQCVAVMAASTATQIVVTVTGTAASGSPTVQLVAVTGSATLATGAAIGVPVASGSQWTFNRGAALGQPGGAQFRAVLAGTISDDDFIEVPEQGRDTTYLASRARVTGSTATTVTVRYAVLDAYSALSTSLTYLMDGIATITPGTPQTVTTAIGTTYAVPETVGSYVDYTITRPVTGLPTGRVTFTASATGRVSDSDAVDVPAQDVGMMAVSAVFSATGAATLSFVGDSTVASFRFAVSTSAFPTLGTVQAATVVNARNSSQSLAGPYALGTSLFVSCVSYTGASGTGKESPIFQYQFIRQNTTPTITNRQPATQVCDPKSALTEYVREAGYYVPGYLTPAGFPPSGRHLGQVIVPKGVTLRAIRVNCYALQPPSGGASGDIITINFYRITDNGVATFVGSTAQNVYAGWQTLAVSSLSEDTTNRSYYVDIFSVWNSAGAPSDLRVAWIESEYDKPNTDANI